VRGAPIGFINSELYANAVPFHAIMQYRLHEIFLNVLFL
jgi:hypothetical protein